MFCIPNGNVHRERCCLTVQRVSPYEGPLYAISGNQQQRPLSAIPAVRDLVHGRQELVVFRPNQAAFIFDDRVSTSNHLDVDELPFHDHQTW
jgi:hypothetical protein